MRISRLAAAPLTILGILVLGGGVVLLSLSSPEAQGDVAKRGTATAPPDTTETKNLRPLMVEIAQDMARINTGIWHEDYELIEEGGSSIANHPKIPRAQMARIKKALGTEFSAFVQFDKTVHQGAAELAEAASNENMSAVLDTYTEVRNGCIGCHTAYRDRVRQVLSRAEFEEGGR